MLPFLQSSGKIPAVKDHSNRQFKGFTTDLSRSCIIRMEKLSHPWPFADLRF